MLLLRIKWHPLLLKVLLLHVWFVVVALCALRCVLIFVRLVRVLFVARSSLLVVVVEMLKTLLLRRRVSCCLVGLCHA